MGGVSDEGNPIPTDQPLQNDRRVAQEIRRELTQLRKDLSAEIQRVRSSLRTWICCANSFHTMAFLLMIWAFALYTAVHFSQLTVDRREKLQAAFPTRMDSTSQMIDRLSIDSTPTSPPSTTSGRPLIVTVRDQPPPVIESFEPFVPTIDNVPSVADVDLTSTINGPDYDSDSEPAEPLFYYA